MNDDEREYDITCEITLRGETPIDAVATYLAVISDFLAGRVEWLACEATDRTTGEVHQVTITPAELLRLLP